jgi:predicted secreted protein
MYVLCSPCVLHPGLRAEGITKPTDLDWFAKTVQRCHTFGIEIVPLPCPETLYLGPDRKPGTYLERLNTPAFSDLLDRLEQGVAAVIRGRGPPLCIIGVNSSPTCGVTSTWYGAEGDKPPKREGRGVFLARFPAIPAVDVSIFSRYRVYLAAPLFSEAERCRRRLATTPTQGMSGNRNGSFSSIKRHLRMPTSLLPSSTGRMQIPGPHGRWGMPMPWENRSLPCGLISGGSGTMSR